jgi:hypothetical protein
MLGAEMGWRRDEVLDLAKTNFLGQRVAGRQAASASGDDVAGLGQDFRNLQARPLSDAKVIWWLASAV